MSYLNKIGFKTTKIGKPLTYDELKNNNRIYRNIGYAVIGFTLFAVCALVLIGFSNPYYLKFCAVLVALTPFAVIGYTALFPVAVRIGAERSTRFVEPMDSLKIKYYYEKYALIRQHVYEIRKLNRPIYYSDMLFIISEGKILEDELKLDEAKAYYAMLHMI